MKILSTEYKITEIIKKKKKKKQNKTKKKKKQNYITCPLALWKHNVA